MEGRKVGFVAGDANWFSKRSRKKVGAVHEIVVLPDFRGMGIGKALMERVLDYFRGKVWTSRSSGSETGTSGR
ncbi:MAG: GNAT family N-acetyltransferase [Aquificota bacterium]|nr:GNAT family N-acetyltransferase [Aquificota bacterium]